jgi:hypothetical protein
MSCEAVIKLTNQASTVAEPLETCKNAMSEMVRTVITAYMGTPLRVVLLRPQ